MTSQETESSTPIPLAKRLRHRVEFFLLWGLRAVIRAVPYPLMRAMASFLGTLAALGDRRGRATARQNLRAAFGNELSPGELNKVIGDCYRQFARTFLELFRTRSSLTPDKMEKFCSIEFEDEAATLAAAREGAIFVTPHYGNFEWLAVAWCFRVHPLTIIAQDSKNPLVTPLFIEERSSCGNQIVSQNGALLKLLRAIKRGNQVALLPDLTTAPQRGGVVIRMFGLKASVTSLPAALAVRTDCAVIPAICIPQPDGRYRLHFARPKRFSKDIPTQVAAQACWDVFEPIIRTQPAPWLWMYKHWRYLPAGEDASSYPPYANRSKAFDRIDPDAQV